MARTKKEKLIVLEEIENTSTPEPAIDVDAIKASLSAEIEQLTKSFENKLNEVKKQIPAANTNSEQRRERIVLTGANQYFIEADNDGLSFSKDNNFISSNASGCGHHATLVIFSEKLARDQDRAISQFELQDRVGQPA